MSSPLPPAPAAPAPVAGAAKKALDKTQVRPKAVATKVVVEREQNQLRDHNLLREGIMKEYLKPNSYNAKDEVALGFSISHVRARARELPAGLQENEESRSLFRAVSNRLKIPYFGAYTEMELRDCIYKVLMQEMKAVHACRYYGVGKTALYNNMKKINVDLRGQELRDQLDATSFPGKGPPRFFVDDEIALKLSQHYAGGTGNSEEQTRFECKQLLNQLAEKLEEGPEKTRLMNAKCTKNWLTATKRRLQSKGLLPSPDGKAAKPNPPQKRAKTHSFAFAGPGRDVGMGGASGAPAVEIGGQGGAGPTSGIQAQQRVVGPGPVAFKLVGQRARAPGPAERWLRAQRAAATASNGSCIPPVPNMAARCEKAEVALLGEIVCGIPVKQRIERLECELHEAPRTGGLQARLEAIESELGL